MDKRSEIMRRLTDPAPLEPAALADLTLDALDHGLFEPIVTRIETAIRDGAEDARLYQVLALARRELLDSAGAVTAFERAWSLAPEDARIAHGLARSVLECGRPAVSHYDEALRLAPNDAGMLMGRAAALVSEGKGEEAKTGMARLLAQHPGWLDGHAAFARIVAASRSTDDGTASVRAALARFPRDPSLWRMLLRLLLDARRYVETLEVVRTAVAQLGEDEEWRRVEAFALSELGEATAAQKIFDELPPRPGAAMLLHPLRNLIRLRRFQEATALAERRFAMAEEATLWPYRALLWRLAGDARWHWLEGDERLIGVYDLGMSPQQIDDLAELLRALHGRSGELPDQSVRGGTQTADMLFRRGEPEIVQLRKRAADAVRDHIACMPAFDQDHPVLGMRRDQPVRFSGSWSVRLGGGGHHAHHVHPEGWFSAALYVALPDTVGGEGAAGWLTLGEPPAELGLDLPPIRLVEPKPGRLVLFPSIMWHGTRPFRTGERLTISFDVSRPQ